MIYRVEQKALAKFIEGTYVRGDGLCISSPKLVGSRNKKFKHAGFFCTTLYKVRLKLGQ